MELISKSFPQILVVIQMCVWGVGTNHEPSVLKACLEGGAKLDMSFL